LCAILRLIVAGTVSAHNKLICVSLLT